MALRIRLGALLKDLSTSEFVAVMGFSDLVLEELAAGFPGDTKLQMVAAHLIVTRFMVMQLRMDQPTGPMQ